MHAILLAWKNALDVLKPHRLWGLAVSSFKSLWKGAYAFGRSFWVFLVADVMLFLLFGSYTASQEALLALTKSSSLALLILLLIQSIIWFLTSTIFFLLVRREEASNDYLYCSNALIKFCQITMLPSFFFIMVVYLLIAVGGITALPTVPWAASLCLRVISLMTIFYWLDTAQQTPKAFFSAIERGINLCFYNLPLIAIFVGVALLINAGCSTLISYIVAEPVKNALLVPPLTILGKLAATFKGRCLFLAFKYGIFIIESIWMAFMLSIYRRKRNEEYTTMFFS